MQVRAVSSTNLAMIGYDPDWNHLFVKFKSGRVYRYEGVAELTWQGLRNAGSHGSYFNANIRDRYSTTELDDSDDPFVGESPESPLRKLQMLDLRQYLKPEFRDRVGLFA